MRRDVESAPRVPPGGEASAPLRFQVRLPSDPRALAVVRSTVSEFASAWGFDGEQCRCITLAVDEALSNIIRHAYKNQCDREIELNCEACCGWVEFALIDCGEPADLSRLCAQPLDEIAFGGRGTHIIRQIMDEVCYERAAGRNRLRLRKYLPGAPKKA